MRRFFIIFFALIIAACAGYGAYYYFSTQVKSIEQILPEGPLAYLRADDVSSMVDQFPRSKFGQALAKIDIIDLMRTSGATDEQLISMKGLKDNLFSPEAAAFFKKFFGHEVAVAIYPVKLEDLDERSIGQILSSFVLVTRLDPDIKFLEFFTRLFDLTGKTLATTTEKYQEKTITSIDLFSFGFGEVNLSYTVLGDYVVMGFNESAARRSIDTLLKGQKRLSEDQNFLYSRSKSLAAAKIQGFLNLAQSISGLKALVLKGLPQTEAMTMTQRRQIDQGLRNLESLQAFAFSWEPGQLSKIRTDLSYNKAKMDEGTRTILSCGPKVNETLKFIPKETLVYQWSECYNWNVYWDEVKKEIASGPMYLEQGVSVKQQVEQLENTLGLSIEKDLLAALGDELGWVINYISLDEPFPIPQGIFFIKVKDKEKMEKMISHALQRSQGVFQQAQYKDINILALDLGWDLDIAPAYAYINDYLLLATHARFLKQAIDASTDQAQSLSANPDFNLVNAGLTEPVNSVFFMESQLVVEKFTKVVHWGSEWVLARYRQKQAYKEGSIKRLAYLKEELETREKELATLGNTLRQQEIETKKLAVQGVPTAENEALMQQARADIEQKKKDIILSKEKVAEQEAVVAGFSVKEEFDPDLVTYYLDNGVYPFLDGVAAFTAVGSKMILGESDMELNIFIHAN